MTTTRSVALVVAGFLAAIVVNFALLPGDHIVSSLYLLPVLAACHVWRPTAVAVAALAAALLYVTSAQFEGRPLAVWPFGVLAIVMGGYLTVQYAVQREAIAGHARRESEERQRLQVFMGMVAHDLAGSLTNIMAGTEMLAESPSRGVGEADRVAVSAINSGTRQARRLLTDLRDASAIGAGAFSVTPARMDVVELATQIVDEQRLSNPDHPMVVDAPERLVGDWDRTRIGQLLTNLVSNACKYSLANGEVRVVVRTSEDGATISVQDEGPGIDPDQQARIFEPFARGASDSGVAGTGLGLWITKAIAEAHGGRIWVESAQGRGSRFTALLPFAAEVAQAPNPARRPEPHHDGIERSTRVGDAARSRPKPTPAQARISGARTSLSIATGNHAR